MNLNGLLQEMTPMLERVGKYQLKAQLEGFGIETKASGIDLVTDIDKQSEKMIIEWLEDHYPGYNILGEESGTRNTDSDYQWIIDPIDGTTNFVHGFPMHCISIGLKHKGERIFGIVEMPKMGYRFHAIKGQGAYLNGKQIGVSKAKNLSEAIISTGFPYTRKEENMNLPYFNKIVNEVAGIRRTGSAACDLCLVAAGMVDGYWEFAINEWDICAGMLLIEEAGGKVTFDTSGKYSLLISGNEAIYEAIASYINT